MAVTITTTLSKKLPMPDLAYASVMASLSISAEVPDISHVPAEAARLYLLADLAVEAQLRLQTATEPANRHQDTMSDRSIGAAIPR